MNNDTVHLACSLNRRYIPHTGALIASIMENLSKQKEVNVNFHLLHSDLTKEDQDSINTFFSRKYSNIRLTFYLVTIADFEDLPIKANHLRIETYYRLAISHLVSDKIERIIYLDSDMIVRHDITELYSTDLKGHLIGAVRDFPEEELCAQLGMKSRSDYFNAGVLLIDLKKWRKEDFTASIISYIREYYDSIFYADQDALNGTLNGIWLRLPERWNLNPAFLYYDASFIGFEDTTHEAISNPSIVHFAGYSKPWILFNEHPFKDLYFKYLLLTPWRLTGPWNLPGKQLVVFGTGRCSEQVSEHYQLNPSYYLDNNKDKAGTRFNNREVFLPSDKIESIKSNASQVILIASIYYEEIREQLNSYGLVQDKDHFAIHDMEYEL